MEDAVEAADAADCCEGEGAGEGFPACGLAGCFAPCGGVGALDGDSPGTWLPPTPSKLNPKSFPPAMITPENHSDRQPEERDIRAILSAVAF